MKGIGSKVAFRQKIVPVSVTALASAAWLLAGCGEGGVLPIAEGEYYSPDRLVLVVDSCGAEPSVSSLDEGPESIEVSIVAGKEGTSNECLDTVEIRLSAELDGREVVDASSGQTIEIMVFD